ncbi:AmiS/UreI family transporter [Pimelobacter simplex]|uniref:AmiS/UreI family transporter n=1 Tax=Nocardioides simplex TaxID=2045 RepID=UPI003AABC286
MSPVILTIGSFMFIIDAMFLLGRADPKSTGVANAVAGGIIGVAGLQVGFTANGVPVLLFLSSLAIIFAGFYLILAGCLLSGFELKALGWWCLGASFWAVFSVHFFAWGPGNDLLFAIFAVTWVVLFFSAWLSLNHDHRGAAVVVPWLLLFDSVVTLMLPAYLLITGDWPVYTL